MPKQLNVSLQMTADTSQAKKQLQDLQNQLSNLAKTGSSSSGSLGLTKEIQNATAQAAQLKTQLQAATDVNTGKLDLTKFTQQMRQSGTSLEQYRKSLAALGPEGNKAFAQLALSISNADAKIGNANSKLKQFGTTLANAARWQISSSVLHGFMSSIQSAMGYAKDLNESLSNIRIVTGQSADQMAEFAVKANKAAQALSTTTTAYTDAALIFAQQGLGTADIEARTNAVIKMAQVTGDSASEVSSYMTAIWNNFADGSQSLEYYEDVIAKLGATTAASSAEISEGISKFASVAQTAGLSYEYATSALATVVAATRQSADTVGTAFKTLFARIQDLELGKTLDDGTTLGQYSEALNKIGVSIKDTSGKMRSMDDILDDMGEKWKTLGQDTQTAVAQAVAGTRQYTQLVALMENWDTMKTNVASASGAEGTVDEQVGIYAESWEAARKRVRAAAEEIYSALIDEDFFIKMDDMFAKMLNSVSVLIKGMGGIPGILTTALAMWTTFSNQLGTGIDNIVSKIYYSTNAGKKAVESQRLEALEQAKAALTPAEGDTTKTSKVFGELIKIQQEIVQNASKLTEQTRERLALNNDICKQSVLEVDEIEKQNRELEEQKKRVKEIYDIKAKSQQEKITNNLTNLIKNRNDIQADKNQFLSDNALNDSEIKLVNNHNAIDSAIAMRENSAVNKRDSTKAIKSLVNSDDFKEDYNKYLQNNNKKDGVDASLEFLKEKQKAYKDLYQQLDDAQKQEIKNYDIELKKLDEKIAKSKEVLQNSKYNSDDIQKNYGDYPVAKKFASKESMNGEEYANVNTVTKDNYEEAGKNLKEYVTTLTETVTMSDEFKNKLIGIVENLDKLTGTPEEKLEAVKKAYTNVTNAANTAKESANDYLKKVEESAQGNTDISKALKNVATVSQETAETQVNLADKVHEANERLQQQDEILKGSVTALPAFGQNVQNLVSGLSSLAMGLQQIKGLGKVWDNDDISVFDKVLTTVTTLGMAIPVLTKAYQNLLNVKKLIMTKDIALNVINNSSLFLAKAHIANADKEAIRTVVLEQAKGKLAKEELIEAAAKALEIDTSQGLSAAQMQELVSTEALKKSKIGLGNILSGLKDKVAGFAAKLGAVGTAAAVAAAVVLIAVGVTKMFQKAEERAIEAERKEIEEKNKLLEAEEEELKKREELYDSYKTAYDEYLKTGKISDDLKTSTLALANAYGGEGAAIASLTGDYESLNETLKQTHELELQKQINNLEQQNAQLTGQGDLLVREQANEHAWYDWFSDKAAMTVDALTFDLFDMDGRSKNDRDKDSLAAKKSYIHLDEAGYQVIDLGDSPEEIVKNYEDALKDSNVDKAVLSKWDDIYNSAKENLKQIKELELEKDYSSMISGQVEGFEDYQKQREALMEKELSAYEKDSEEYVNAKNEIMQYLLSTSEGSKYESYAQVFESGKYSDAWEKIYKENKNNSNFNEDSFFELMQVFPQLTDDEARTLWDTYKTGFEKAQEADQLVLKTEAIEKGLQDLTEKMSENKWNTFFEDTSSITWGENGIVSKDMFKTFSYEKQKSYLNDLNEQTVLLSKSYEEAANSYQDMINIAENDLIQAILSEDKEQVSILTAWLEKLNTKLSNINTNKLKELNSEIEKSKAEIKEWHDEIDKIKLDDTLDIQLVTYLKDIGVDNLENYLLLMADGTAKLVNAAEDFKKAVQSKAYSSEVKNSVESFNNLSDYINNYSSLNIQKDEMSKGKYYSDQEALLGLSANYLDDNNIIQTATADAQLYLANQRMLASEILQQDTGSGKVRNAAHTSFNTNRDKYLELTGGEKTYNPGYNVENLTKSDIQNETYMNFAKTQEGENFIASLQSRSAENLKSLAENAKDDYAKSLAIQKEIERRLSTNTDGLETFQTLEDDISKAKEEIDTALAMAGVQLTTDLSQVSAEEYEEIAKNAIKASLHESTEEFLFDAVDFEDLKERYKQIYSDLGTELADEMGTEYYSAWQNLNQQAEMTNVDSKELESYTKTLTKTATKVEEVSDSLSTNKDIAREVAREVIRMNKGVEALSSGFAGWNSILTDSNASSQEYSDALNSLLDAASDLLDINEDFLTEDFLTDKKNLADFEKAANGDADAIDRLKDAAASSIILKITTDNNIELTDELNSYIDNIQNGLKDIKIGGEVDSELINQFNNLIDMANMTEDQIEAMADALKLDVQYETVDVDVPKTYTTTTTHRQLKNYDGPGDDEYDIEETITDVKTYDSDDTVSMVAFGVNGDSPKVSGSQTHVKSATKKATGAMNNGSSSNSGSSAKKSKADKSQMKDNKDIERYHEINQTLSTIDRQLTKINNTESRAFGKDKIAAIREQAAALEQQAEAYMELNREANAYLEQDRNAVIGIGAQIDEFGTISNYTSLMEQFNDQYNQGYLAYINASNAATTDAAKEAAEEAWKSVQEDYNNKVKLIQNYENSLAQEQESAEKARQAFADAYDKKLSEIQVSVELNINISDRKLKMLQSVFDDMGDDVDKTVDKMANLGKQIEENFGKVTTKQNSITSILNNTLNKTNGMSEEQIKKAGLENVPKLSEEAKQGIIERFKNGSMTDDDLNILSQFKITDAEMSELMSASEELLSLNSEIKSKREELLARTISTYEKMNEEIDRNAKHLQSLANQTKAYQNIIDTVGRKIVDPDGSATRAIAAANSQNAQSKASIAKTKVDAIDSAIAMQEAAIVEAHRNGSGESTIKKLQEDLKKMQEDRDAAQEDWLSSWEEAFEEIGNEFDTNLTLIVDEFGEAVAGAAGSIANLQESYNMQANIAADYLQDYEKIYNLSKLNRDITKSMNDSSNIKNNQRLAALQKEINETLQSDAKISEYTAENYRRQYELLLAQDQLEQARNNKSTLKLKRDSQGNYSYQYGTDEDNIAAAQQNYEDKLYALQKANYEYQNKMQEAMINIDAWYTEYVASLDKTDEHYQEKLDAATKYYNTQMTYYSGELGLVLNNNKKLYDNEWTAYSAMTGYKKSADDQYVDSWGETILKQKSGFDTLKDYQDTHVTEAGKMVTAIKGQYSNYQTAIQTTFSMAGTSVAGFASLVKQTVSDMASENTRLAENTKKIAETYLDTFSKALDYAVDFCGRYDSQISSIIDTNSDLYNSITSLLEAYASLAAASDISKKITINYEINGNSNPDYNLDTGSGDNDKGIGEVSSSPNYEHGYKIHNILGEQGGYEKADTAGQWIVSNLDKVRAEGGAILKKYEDGATDGLKYYIVGNNSTTDKFTNEILESMVSADKYYEAFDTGGYTGNWNSSDGKLAMLHQKELILNANDTDNMLNIIDSVRSITDSFQTNAANSLAQMIAESIAAALGNTTNINHGDTAQNITINADFPAASSAYEIETALNSLVGRATQRAGISKNYR